jgi:hypothetical protein
MRELIRAAYQPDGAAKAAFATKAASNTRFSGQRHVVSGAQMWQTGP